MVNLRGLTELRMLDLSGTKITDAGMANLKEYDGVGGIGPWEDEVTDAGLEHLQKMTDYRI